MIYSFILTTLTNGSSSLFVVAKLVFLVEVKRCLRERETWSGVRLGIEGVRSVSVNWMYLILRIYKSIIICTT